MRLGIMPSREALTAPSEPVPATEPLAPIVTPIGQAPSARRTSRPMLAVLAVAACIIALLGVVAVTQTQRLNDGQSVEEMASAAAADSKLKVELGGGDDGSARAVVGADGKGYLIMDGVAPPEDGKVYQLWGKVDDTVLSLGTFGDASVVPFSVDPSRIGDIELFAVTKEDAPGVIESSNTPVMAGTV